MNSCIVFFVASDDFHVNAGSWLSVSLMQVVLDE